MGTGEIILLAMALSVDSLAVSMSGSVTLGKLKFGNVGIVVLTLGTIQTIFFLCGFYAGEVVSNWIEKFGPYVGFCLLLYVAGGMIRESLSKDVSVEKRDFSSIWKIILAAIATSIDAVAVGASMGLSGTVSGKEVCSISVATFIATVLFATAGMFCGCKIGTKFGKPAGLVAGIVLLIIGIGLLIK